MNLLHGLFIISLILVTSPVFFLISIIILLTNGLPIIFQQKRVGKDGKIFLMYKFRTMVNDADAMKSKYKKLNIADGPAFKIPNDPRFTGIGKVLSHTGLDELPQLFNVLKGDMALIGPRPLPVDEAKKLTERQQKRHVIKPGIISPWILNGYHKISFDEWMKSDILYTKTKSFKSDVCLAAKAVHFLLRLIVKELVVRL